MLDRSIAPKISIPNELVINNPKQICLDTKIPTFIYPKYNHKIIKLDFIYQNGKTSDTINGESYFISKLLQSGTDKINFKQVASKLDYYGSDLAINAYRDYSHIQFLFTEKFFHDLMPFFFEIISKPLFEKEYFELIKNKEKKTILLNNKKNNILAHKKLRELVFGKNHPYGKSLTQNDIDQLNMYSLQSNFEKNFYADLQCFICGEDQYIVNTISKYINNLKLTSNTNNVLIQNEHNEKFEYIKTNNNIQASISIGKKFPIKNHEDYINLYIINEFLGGYFGSRLMTKIREEKGYTYGIYSQIIPLFKSSLFCIFSDIKKGFAEKAIDDIFEEIKKLQTIPIKEEELDNFKLYMRGKLLLSFNNPYNCMDMFINSKIHNLSSDFYKKLYESINNISSEVIRNLSIKYFDTNTMSKVIVGR